MSRRRILVVDDEVHMIQVVSKWLQLEGFDVFIAHDGEEAVAKAVADPPDAIVLDLVMPKCNGFEACTKMRQHPPLKTVPIIFFSGKYGGMDDAQLREWGADAFLSKVEGSKPLIAKIRALLADGGSEAV